MATTGKRLRRIASVVRAPRGRVYDLSLQIGRADVHVLRGGDDALVVRLMHEAGSVRIEVLASGERLDDDVERAIDAASRIAGLDDDPRGFASLARKHPTLERLQRRFAGARMTTTPTVWIAFADTVVRQLVTYQEARDALRRMTSRWGALVPMLRMHAFPTPQDIAAAAPSDLRALGVGLRRALTLQRGARLADRLERLRELDLERAKRWISRLHGVGPWSTAKIAIEALGDVDGVLVGDAGVPSLITQALTGRRGDDAAMIEALEPFRPHRARVLHLLRLASIRGGVPGVAPRPMPKVDAHRLRPWVW